MRNIQLVIALFLVFICLKVKGQNDEVPKISLKYGIVAKTFQDSVVLRWAPNSPNALPAHIEAGVWIEKLSVSGKYPYKIGNWERITKSPIKPASIENFNKDVSKKNEFAMLGAQLLYGKIPNSPGASEIEQVKDQASMLNSLFSLAMLGCDYSPMAAQLMGLRTSISIKIKPEEKIFFRIYSAYRNSLFSVDTTMTFSTYNEWNADQRPKFLNAVSMEKLVELRWPFNKELYRWSGFYIERSIDGKSFERLNKKPYIIMSTESKMDVYYRDSVQNYIKYYYRIQAIDPFGDLTDYSEIIPCYGSDKTPPGKIRLNEKTNEGNGIKLDWTFEKSKPDLDLDHFIVKKGPGVDFIQDTIIVLPKSTYTYYFDQKAKIKSTYFEIVAVDTAGNSTSSNPVRYFIPDTEPPKIPEAFTATIDTNGIVHLNWKIDSLDELLGYRVFRKNALNHEFVCLQQGFLKQAEFTDTLALNTLTNEIFYSVAAIDESYNMSKLAETIRLEKPDKIAPAPPQIYDYMLNSGKVTLRWQASPSEDVASYEIYRAEDAGIILPVQKGLKLTQFEFTDSLLANHKKYSYYLKSVDKSGLVSSYSFPLEIIAYTNNQKKNIQLIWLSEKDKTGFKWLDPNPKPDFYILFKDLGDGLLQYTNVDATQTQYLDKINTTKRIRYGIQAVYPNQSKSEIYTLDWKSNN